MVQSKCLKLSKRNLRNGIDHVKTHLDSVTSVVSVWLREPGHTVVAVPEDLDTKTFVVLNMKC